MKKNNAKVFLSLHVLLLFYSLGAVCSKLASDEPFLSVRFIVLYGIVLLNLFIYAIAWQQILKKLPLVTAYANKACTVIWGLLWGMLFFDEAITIWKVIGACVIMMGIYMVVKADEK